MIKLDPMIKLAILVAIGITVTMLFGIGKPDEQIKLTIINKSQTNVNLPRANPLQAREPGGFQLENYVALDK